jgi:CHRD domain-containing protein
MTRSRAPFTLAAVLIASACGGAATAPSPTIATSAAPPTATASAQPMVTPGPDLYTYSADLKSSNEIPAIADAEATCAGKATFTMEAITDPSYYNIVSAKGAFDITITGCPASTSIILAHIHEGAATTNGPVKIDTGLVASAPITFGTGARIQKASITVDPQTAQALVTNPGGYYVNVHTAAHGGGVIRGQLVATR